MKIQTFLSICFPFLRRSKLKKIGPSRSTLLPSFSKQLSNKIEIYLSKLVKIVGFPIESSTGGKTRIETIRSIVPIPRSDSFSYFYAIDRSLLLPFPKRRNFRPRFAESHVRELLREIRNQKFHRAGR